MNMTQLKCLTAILDTGSFTEAAYQLFMAQSSVSKHIASLERELGVPLFDRQGRGAEPTEFCQLFAQEARAILRHYEAALQQAKVFLHHQDEVIRVSAIPAVIPYQLDAIFAAFRARYPALTIQVEEKEPSEVLRDLDAGLCDFAITRDFFEDPAYCSCPVGSDSLAAVVALSHPLAQAGEISLTQLAHDDWILLSQKTGMYDFTLRSCAACGFQPRILWALSRIAHVLDSVAAGKGVSLLMRQTLSYSNREDIAVLPLTERFESKLLLLWRKDAVSARAAALFLAFVKGLCTDAENG